MFGFYLDSWPLTGCPSSFFLFLSSTVELKAKILNCQQQTHNHVTCQTGWGIRLYMYMYMQVYRYFSSLVNQTTPFCSTGCIASPGRRRAGLATLAQFLGHSPECWDDQRDYRVIMNNLNVSGLEIKVGLT